MTIAPRRARRIRETTDAAPEKLRNFRRMCGMGIRLGGLVMADARLAKPSLEPRVTQTSLLTSRLTPNRFS